jgi:RNA polymerase sigma factor (sigma-70 family)
MENSINNSGPAHLQKIFKNHQNNSSPYAGILMENLDFIKKQCHKAMAHLPLSPDTNLRENEVNELINDVIERLSADDFKALRAFEGRSKITTYISTIIANIIVDAVRSKKGRNRIHERAKEIGDLGLRLYDLIFVHNYNLQEAHEHLKTSCGITKSLMEISDILDRIRGRQTFLVANSTIAYQESGTESGDQDLQKISLPDNSKKPDELIIEKQRAQAVQQMLAEIISELKGEDRLMLRMKYPVNEMEHPRNNGEIAEMLGLKEKAIESRIRRILLKCRESILQRGLSIDDFIEI